MDYAESIVIHMMYATRKTIFITPPQDLNFPPNYAIITNAIPFSTTCLSLIP